MKRKIIILFTSLVILLLGISSFLVYKYNIINAIRLADKENYTIHYGKLPFTIEDNRLFIESKINNKDVKLYFDTGASGTIIFDSLHFIKDKKTNKRVFSGSTVKTPDGGEIKSNNGLVNFKNSILTAKPQVYLNIKKTKYLCTSFDGFFSLATFIEDEKIVKLDFQNKNIEICPKLVKTGYTELPFKTDFMGNLFIEGEIEGEKSWAKLDTGFDGVLISKSKYKQSKDIVSYQSTQGQTFKDNKEKYHEFKFNKEIAFAIGKNKYTIEVLEGTAFNKTEPNLGLQFIKNFNWIFDFKNEKAYFSPINANTNFSTTKQAYYTKSKNGAITIIAKNKIVTEYNLGDQIILVNNIKISNENACYFENLLNKTVDWNKLNLKIIKNKKL